MDAIESDKIIMKRKRIINKVALPKERIPMGWRLGSSEVSGGGHMGGIISL